MTRIRRVRGAATTVALAIVLVASALVAVTTAEHQAGAQVSPGDPFTELVVLGTGGELANGDVRDPALSHDGRFVAFASSASNLVAGDTNSVSDVFVRDRQTGTVERVSVSSDGVQGNVASTAPAISPNGRYVAFLSQATTLVPVGTTPTVRVFLHDRQTDTTELISQSSEGVVATGPSSSADVSADGRYVAFASSAVNLVEGDTNGWSDVFVRDREAGTTERVSLDHAGGQIVNGPSVNPSISGDGQLVAFSTEAPNVVPGDTQVSHDVFVRDRVAGTTERGSLGTGSVAPTPFAHSRNPSISDDGRFLAFDSATTNFVEHDSNVSYEDIFVRDRLLDVTVLVSKRDNGTQGLGASIDPQIAADGSAVVFHSNVNLEPVPLDSGPGQYVHDLGTGTTERVSVLTDGTRAVGNPMPGVALSGNGRYTAFTMVEFGFPSVWHTYLRDLGAPPAALVALEVTQGTQSWRNGIQLVGDRTTIARVHLQTGPGEDPREISGVLVGRRDGVSFPYWLTPINEGAAIEIDGDADARRGDLDGTLNFELPLSWRHGTVELEFLVHGQSLRCLDISAPDPNDCKTTVTFEEATDDRITVWGVSYEETVGTATVVREPSQADLEETVARMRSVLPTSRLVPTIRDLETTFEGVPEADDVNGRLDLLHQMECVGTSGRTCNDLFYGHIWGQIRGLARGIPGNVSSSGDDGGRARNAVLMYRNVGSHEVGHSLGLHHPVVPGWDENMAKHGVCGEVADGHAPDYPYFGPIFALGTQQWALLGPLNAPVNEMWGLDPRFLHDNTADLAVVSPRGTNAAFELMSYCQAGAPQRVWPSAVSWIQLRDGLRERFTPGAAPVVGGPGAGVEGPHLLVGGSVDLDDGDVTLELPAVVGSGLDAPAPGDHAVRLLGADGTVLAEVPFEPTEGSEPESSDGGPPLPGDDSHAHGASFLVSVPVPEVEIDRIVVVHDDEEVAALESGSSAPTANPVAPSPGSVNDADDVTFSWEGEEGVAYHVQYSPDGGTTWKVLAIAFEGTSITVPRSQLVGSTNAVFEVQAVDGASVSTEVSGPFTVVNNAPEVDITAPSFGGATFESDQLVLLEATANDPEDGDVSDSITWTSDRDGALEVSDGFVEASELTEGTHTVTASAADSSGAVGSASVTIVVGEADDPVEPETVTYTARYDAQRCAAIEAWSAGMGLAPAEMIRLGVNGFRGVAEEHPGTTYAELTGGTMTSPALPSEDVACEFEVVWDAGEQAALESAAAWWGVSGDQLHDGGGWLVVVLIYRALVGLG